MTPYGKITREEIARRDYTEGATRAYLRALDDLSQCFQRPQEQLPFFYLTALNRPWRGHELP